MKCFASFARDVRALLVVAACLSVCALITKPADAQVFNGHYQTVDIPAYFTDTTSWQTMGEAFPTANIVVANFGTPGGPGTAYNAAYASLVRNAQASGLTVIGYVDTGYNNGTVSLSTIETQICEWMNWYAIDGIFLDDVPVTTSGNTAFYGGINTYVKSFFGSALTVLNCGWYPTDDGYMSCCDIVIDYEDPYSDYAQWAAGYQYYSWISNYPAKRFWNIIYDCPASELSTAISTSETVNAGNIYVTPLDLDSEGVLNPYDALPNSSYWLSEIQQVGAF